MTREQARKCAEVMMAYANGKEIEYRKHGCDTWSDIPGTPVFNWHQSDYRIKKEPKEPKFDPKTLKPFGRVLVWKDLDSIWMPTIFTFLDFSLEYPRMRYNSLAAKVIPYNNDTKHLVGTTKEAPEYYRYWED